ncbi:GL14912 [Drosophila persimilis]|uniref:GL14912 n=1 Tax=Drosophila persimilis TaxID=7234 RepID=B4H077_DROPE|nr:GL14912 [Drosophila persimilis]
MVCAIRFLSTIFDESLEIQAESSAIPIYYHSDLNAVYPEECLLRGPGASGG